MANATNNLILNVAEKLFAEHGFADTSVRQITEQAQVNVAAVNYHFGSKNQLIQAVLQRYLAVLMPAMEAQLLDLQRRQSDADVAIVLHSLQQPLLALDAVRPDGTSLFVRLLGRAYIENQGHLRKFFMQHYANVVQLLIGMIQYRMPQLSASQLFWRLHFALGCCLFSLASSQALLDIAVIEYQQHQTVADMLPDLIDFICAGVIAPLNDSQQLTSGPATAE